MIVLNVIPFLCSKVKLFIFRYPCMSKERFEHLRSLVEALIKKQDTRFRKSIPTRERLVITLRYLSSVCSQQNLNFKF